MMKISIHQRIQSRKNEQEVVWRIVAKLYLTKDKQNMF